MQKGRTSSIFVIQNCCKVIDTFLARTRKEEFDYNLSKLKKKINNYTQRNLIGPISCQKNEHNMDRKQQVERAKVTP